MGHYKGTGKEVIQRVKSSSEVFEEIVKTSTAKGRRSLENLRKMCDMLESRGVEITVSSIARESKRLQLAPGESALRNNPKLWSYVLLRQSETGLRTKDLRENEDLEELVIQLRNEVKVLRSFIRNMKIKVN